MILLKNPPFILRAACRTILRVFQQNRFCGLHTKAKISSSSWAFISAFICYGAQKPLSIIWLDQIRFFQWLDHSVSEFSLIETFLGLRFDRYRNCSCKVS